MCKKLSAAFVVQRSRIQTAFHDPMDQKSLRLLLANILPLSQVSENSDESLWEKNSSAES